MSRSAPLTTPVEPGALGRAGLVVGAITALRLAALALDRTDLFVDEAQYWAWGQSLDWGYFSKPPLIGWVLRAATELSGSDAAFWIRAPGALFHGATALILGAAAGRLFGAAAIMPTALAYATLPMVALGSLLISTDTIMAPFYAAGIAFWLRLTASRAWRDAALFGLMAGLAIMAKYAGLYLIVTLGLAALLSPAFRVPWSRAALGLAVAALTVSPNIAWNFAHDLTTLAHTADNVDWVRADPQGTAGWNIAGMAEFALSQFAVFGPVLFGGLLARAARGGDPAVRGLLWMSLPIVALICVQAALSRAYANWAVAAYFAGTLAVAFWLASRHRRWWAASLAINGALCVALPLLTIFPAAVHDGEGRPLLRRYLGRAALSQAAIATARDTGAAAIVAEHRDILADLVHAARDSGPAIYAAPPEGPPGNFYAQTRALPPQAPGPLLWVGDDAPAPCEGIAEAARLPTEGGAYDGRDIRAWLVPETCRHVLD